MSSWSIEWLEMETGNVPVLDWIRDMSEKEQGIVLWHIDQLEHLGMEARMPLVRPLGDKLYELRIRAQGKNQRIAYFAASGRKFVLVHGFTKKQKTTPQREKEIALRRMRDYKRRFAE
jgi:phage-related protein